MICFLVLLLVFAEDPQVIFESGENGYHTYRIPALIQAKNKDLLAFCEGRKNSRSDTGNIDLLLRRSPDQGITWTQQTVIWDDGENVCGNPCPVLDEETGELFLLLTWNSGEDHESEIVKGTSEDTRRVFVSSSKDHGLTWNKPKEITKDVKRKNWTWYATGPGVGIQLRLGPHKGRLIIPCDHKRKEDKTAYHSHVIYSDDHGKTWRLGGVSANGANECQVVERKDGSLLLNMRRARTLKAPYRLLAESCDGGMTWSNHFINQVLIDPRCQGSLIRKTPSDSREKPLLIFSNVGHKTSRMGLMVRISENDGLTWEKSRLLYPGPAAYSCLVSLQGTRAACLFEGGEKSPYGFIYFVRFEVF